MGLDPCIEMDGAGQLQGTFGADSGRLYPNLAHLCELSSCDRVVDDYHGMLALLRNISRRSNSEKADSRSYIFRRYLSTLCSRPQLETMVSVKTTEAREMNRASAKPLMGYGHVGITRASGNNDSTPRINKVPYIRMLLSILL